jgi:hypothetical protein
MNFVSVSTATTALFQFRLAHGRFLIHSPSPGRCSFQPLGPGLKDIGLSGHALIMPNKNWVNTRNDSTGQFIFDMTLVINFYSMCEFHTLKLKNHYKKHKCRILKFYFTGFVIFIHPNFFNFTLTLILLKYHQNEKNTVFNFCFDYDF